MATLACPQSMTLPTLKLATRFRSWADALDAKIQYLGRPMSQNPTPKRNREYQSRLLECRNLERTQKALRALALAHENGSILHALAQLKTKDEIGRMVRKYCDGSKGGYYACIECDDFSDTSPAARLLQSMIEGSSHERAERERLRKIGALQAEIALLTIPGYFPTPAPVVEIVLRRARIEAGMRVCEPEAGSGHIADAIRAACPGAWVDTIEIHPRLREILMLKNYRVMAWDLLDCEIPERYDRIVMNPPFERQQDIDHVQKAFSLLADGGILVAIVSSGFEYRSDRKSTEFRAWLDSVNASWGELAAGAFKASGTGVATRVLAIER